MPFYRPGEHNATDEVVIAEVFASAEEPAVAEHRVVGPPAGMVAVRVADLSDTSHGRGGGALVVAGGSGLVRGEAVVFCHPVLSAPTVIRRDGRGQAEGWRPDQVRRWPGSGTSSRRGGSAGTTSATKGIENLELCRR